MIGIPLIGFPWKPESTACAILAYSAVRLNCAYHPVLPWSYNIDSGIIPISVEIMHIPSIPNIRTYDLL